MACAGKTHACFPALSLVVMRIGRYMRAFLIPLTVLSVSCFASEHMKSSDVELAHILSTSEVVYQSKDFPEIKIIRSWEQISECGGTYQSCPNARLFIIVTPGDLYQPPLLYELPKSKGWEVLSTESTEKYLTVIVTTSLNHANVSQESRSEWAPKVYKLKISTINGSVNVIE